MGANGAVGGVARGPRWWSWNRAGDLPLARAVSIMFRASPGLATVRLALVVVDSALAAAQTIAIGLFVGAVPGAVAARNGAALVGPLAAVAVVQLVQAATGPLAIVQNLLSFRTGQYVRSRVIEACNAPAGIAHLEDTAFQDELKVGSGYPNIQQVANSLPAVATVRLSGVAAGIILVQFAWWAPVAILLATLVQHRWLTKEMTFFHAPFVRTAHDRRRSDYYRSAGLLPSYAKELRAFGLASFVVDRFMSHWRAGMREVWDARRSIRPLMLASLGALILANLGVAVAIGRAALDGDISLGALAIYLGAAGGVANFGIAGDADQILGQALKTIPHLESLHDRAVSSPANVTGTVLDIPAPREVIRFESVRFSYPGTDASVFDGLDLAIRAGESTAIVGANGAGKTTLVKLLARLYDPDDGRITIDGTDLRDIDPAAWRRHISVIFQDFVRFDLTVRENVGFGDLVAASDESATARAAQLAGATAVVESLPRRWDSVLSKTYTDGVELSGGQWQRIALARALMRAGRGAVLVLDEPTASLDVRAEAELFDRFLDITTASTTILISHRFSTVRRAERIVVLENGKIVESGSHDELLAGRGRYAELFTLQAARFRDEP